jgi:hypothetical protein
MLQNVDGKLVYVVVIPETPVFPVNNGGDPQLTPYADALNSAILMGYVREAGKYAIEIDQITSSWTIHNVIE